jgi:hypothetical protein
MMNRMILHRTEQGEDDMMVNRRDQSKHKDMLNLMVLMVTKTNLPMNHLQVKHICLLMSMSQILQW